MGVFKIPMLLLKIPPAGIFELPAGSIAHPEQADGFLYRTADPGSGRALDLAMHTGKPGQCDPAFHLPGSVHGDPDPAPERRIPASGAHRENCIIRTLKTTISAHAEMVVFSFPGLQQFPGFGRGSIPASSGKIRRSERLKTPKIAPKNYSKKGESVCLECRRK